MSSRPQGSMARGSTWVWGLSRHREAESSQTADAGCGAARELLECPGPGKFSLPFRLQCPPSGRQIWAPTVLKAAAAGHSLSCLRFSPALTAPDPRHALNPQGVPEPWPFLGPLYSSCSLDSQILSECPDTFHPRCTPSFRHSLSPSFSRILGTCLATDAPRALSTP